MNETRLRETFGKAFKERLPSSKLKQQMYEYAVCHSDASLATLLSKLGQYEPARHYATQRASLAAKYLAPCIGRNTMSILAQCDPYGIDHPTTMNQTPLMMAAMAGNTELVETLLNPFAIPPMPEVLLPPSTIF